MISGTVDTIRRYPVKSMRGEWLDDASASVRGLAGDRVFALIDRETGKVASAKHPRLWGMLLGCAATFQQQHPLIAQITLLDGRQLLSNQPDIDRTLSRMIGRDVTLTSVLPADAQTEREYPDVEGLPVSGMFFSAPIAGGAPAGTFFDFAPLHIVTTATLARLRAAAPTSAFDAQRFRPNLVIDTGDREGFVENDWVGKTLHIGDDVRLRVTDPTPRCVVPTLPQPDLPRDVAILRAIAQHNRPAIPTLGGVEWPSVGVYASVEQGGTIHVGDRVFLASD